jgi:hypothetical protein
LHGHRRISHCSPAPLSSVDTGRQASLQSPGMLYTDPLTGNKIAQNEAVVQCPHGHINLASSWEFGNRCHYSGCGYDGKPLAVDPQVLGAGRAGRPASAETETEAPAGRRRRPGMWFSLLFLGLITVCWVTTMLRPDQRRLPAPAPIAPTATATSMLPTVDVLAVPVPTSTTPGVQHIPEQQTEQQVTPGIIKPTAQIPTPAEPTPVPIVECDVTPGKGKTAIFVRPAPSLSTGGSPNLPFVESGVWLRVLSKHKSADGLFLKVLTPTGQYGWVPESLCRANGDLSQILDEPSGSIAVHVPSAATFTAQGGSEAATVVAPSQSSQPAELLTARVQEDCTKGNSRTWFDGLVWINGRPANNYLVWFMSARVAPDSSDRWSKTTGPHTGYQDWNDGYYAHVVDEPYKAVRHLKIWVTTIDGRPVSQPAFWDTNCSYARIDFGAP